MNMEERWLRFANYLSKEWTSDQIAGAKTAYYSGATAALAEVAHVGAEANTGAGFIDGVTRRVEDLNAEIRAYFATRRRPS